MKQNASDILVEGLMDWGVKVVFGLPGDGINGIMEALRKNEDRIRFIQVRHEESAAFMACGYAKYTGKLGVCLATSGPGGIHLLNGLYDAKLDGQPVLAITGHHYHDLIDTQAQQDVDLDLVFKDADYLRRLMPLLVRHAVLNHSCADVMRFLGRKVNQSGEIPANFSGVLQTDLKRRQEGERVKYKMNGNSAKLSVSLIGLHEIGPGLMR